MRWHIYADGTLGTHRLTSLPIPEQIILINMTKASDAGTNDSHKICRNQGSLISTTPIFILYLFLIWNSYNN